MAKSTAFVLTESSQKSFIQYYRETMLLVNDIKSAQRNRFIEIDKAYQREKDTSDEQVQATAFNKGGDTSKLQNITVPVVMPQVESAVVYQTSVFLTGVPIFGTVANPQFMDEAMQLETVLSNNATRGGWTRQLMMFFRDGAKYNFAPIEVSWERETVVSLTTDIQFSASQGKPVDTVWAGNSLTRLDPYNTFVDPRVDPSEVYSKGEFAGYTDLISRIELKQLIAEMSDTIVQNVTKAFESPRQGNPAYNNSEDISERFYVPDINTDIDASDQYEDGMNWLSWVGIDKKGTKSNKAIEYKNSYEKTVLYCKILPSEFSLNVPGANTPQIWKLLIINHSVIIHAERQTNAHGWLPILIGQPQEDGLAYQTKSLATNAKPFQEVTSAFMNSIMASRRRAISDRTLFDPSRVLAAHMNSDNPSAKIPVRPSAYGKKISDAVYQFPYREDQGAFSMSQIGQLLNMSNLLAGQNPAKQGQFVKGNKTKEEFSDTMQNANGRDQLVSILYEDQVFTPMKSIFKLDILQFQGAETLLNSESEQQVDIDPVKLRKAVLEFKITDGLVPASKVINGDTLGVALQVIGSSPQIGVGYNIAPLFSYLMKTQGAKIGAFEKSPEQVAYEQAVNQWSAIAQALVEKGGDPSTLPPQPIPQAYGYNPANQGGGVEEESKANQLPPGQQSVSQQPS